MASLQRLDQVSKPDDFDDQKTAGEISGVETGASDFGEFLEGILSQLKRIIHGNHGGKWHDDPASVFGADASLYALFQQYAAEKQVDLQDNNTEYIVIGDITVDKKIVVNYSFELPIDGNSQAGWITVMHNNVQPDMTHAYSYMDDELETAAFSVDLDDDSIRLKIVTDQVGENPKLVYRVSTLKLAT